MLAATFILSVDRPFVHGYGRVVVRERAEEAERGRLVKVEMRVARRRWKNRGAGRVVGHVDVAGAFCTNSSSSSSSSGSSGGGNKKS